MTKRLGGTISRTPNFLSGKIQKADLKQFLASPNREMRGCSADASFWNAGNDMEGNEEGECLGPGTLLSDIAFWRNEDEEQSRIIYDLTTENLSLSVYLPQQESDLLFCDNEN